MIAQVRPRELSTWLKAAGGAGKPVLLDVREPAELLAASVKPADFTLVAIPMGQLVSRLGDLDPQRPVACLCHHGGRSNQVAAFLESRGFTTVANIAGGIHAWADELDPGIGRY
jgi:rhodanese-related sulfurtransferase